MCTIHLHWRIDARDRPHSSHASQLQIWDLIVVVHLLRRYGNVKIWSYMPHLMTRSRRDTITVSWWLQPGRPYVIVRDRMRWIERVSWPGVAYRWSIVCRPLHRVARRRVQIHGRSSLVRSEVVVPDMVSNARMYPVPGSITSILWGIRKVSLFTL